jgi:hypothetical protein
MVLSIPISSDTEARLKARAAAAGVDVETYAAQQLERVASMSRNLAVISGPVAEAFAQSGMTEDQLAQFLETEKHEMRAQQRTRKSS